MDIRQDVVVAMKSGFISWNKGFISFSREADSGHEVRMRRPKIYGKRNDFAEIVKRALEAEHLSEDKVRATASDLAVLIRDVLGTIINRATGKSSVKAEFIRNLSIEQRRELLKQI